MEILGKDTRILRDPATSIGVVELADSSVNTAVRPRVNSGDYWGLNVDILERVKKRFDAEGIIFKMVLNLFVKAATSPFALLGAILGDVEELSYVEFDYGRATLAQGKTKSLDALITALYERPGLKLELEIEGFVDSDKDTTAMRDARFVRKIKAQKFRSVVKRQPDITVDEIVIKDDEYEKYLWRAYKKEKFTKPRNIIGLTKKITVPEIEKLMLFHIKITKDDLRELARARSQAVRDYIVDSGKVEEERLCLKEGR